MRFQSGKTDPLTQIRFFKPCTHNTKVLAYLHDQERDSRLYPPQLSLGTKHFGIFQLKIELLSLWFGLCYAPSENITKRKSKNLKCRYHRSSVSFVFHFVS